MFTTQRLFYWRPLGSSSQAFLIAVRLSSGALLLGQTEVLKVFTICDAGDFTLDFFLAPAHRLQVLRPRISDPPDRRLRGRHEDLIRRLRHRLDRHDLLGRWFGVPDEGSRPCTKNIQSKKPSICWPADPSQ